MIRIKYKYVVLILFISHIQTIKSQIYNCYQSNVQVDSTFDFFIKKKLEEKSITKYEEQMDACFEFEYLKKQISKTVPAKHLNKIVSFRFSPLKRDNLFFTINQLIFRSNRSAKKVFLKLNGLKDKSFNDEGKTKFDFFRTKNCIYFYTASRINYDKNISLFVELKEWVSI